MKLKYYLRGLGIGIIVTTIILTVNFSKDSKKMSDSEILERASELGMVMAEQDTQSEAEAEMNAEELLASVTSENTEQQMTEPETEMVPETEVVPETEAVPETESEPQAESTEAQEETTQETQTETYRLTIKKGDVCRTVCENLAANRVVDDAEAFRKYLFEIGYASSISTGEYDVPYGLSMEEVAKVLQAGPITQE